MVHVTEFDLRDLCFLESQGHNPQKDRLPDLSGLLGSYIPSFNLISVNLFELSHRKGCLQIDRQTPPEHNTPNGRKTKNPNEGNLCRFHNGRANKILELEQGNDSTQII